MRILDVGVVAPARSRSLVHSNIQFAVVCLADFPLRIRVVKLSIANGLSFKLWRHQTRLIDRSHDKSSPPLNPNYLEWQHGLRDKRTGAREARVQICKAIIIVISLRSKIKL